MSLFCSLSSDAPELRFFPVCGRSFGANVSAISRSFSDCDFCSCSSADAGVGVADFFLGPILPTICCLLRGVAEVLMMFVLVNVAPAPTRRVPRGGYRMRTSLTRCLDPSHGSQKLARPLTVLARSRSRTTLSAWPKTSMTMNMLQSY